MIRPGLRSLLALAALAACSGPPAPAPATTPPTTPATTPPTTTPPASDSAGFADPKTDDDAQAEPAKPGGPPDPELVARITQTFGERCKYERACGELVGIDCDSAVDGPYYYVQRSDLKTVSTCGGACRSGCTDCPPKAWTCPAY
jgi:hypothetical protein